jgi:peptidoglycan/xylan/chitin deacetylase (PgdA/CDA1 family)
VAAIPSQASRLSSIPKFPAFVLVPSISVCVLCGKVWYICTCMGNIRKFILDSLYFRVLITVGFLFAFGAMLVSWRQQPAVLGAMTHQQQPQQVYRPAVPQRALPATGKAQVFYRIPTTEPVIFLTIDDGIVKNQAGFEAMQQKGAVATLFLNDSMIKEDYDYFARWQAAGSSIQNHTVNHPYLRKLTFAQQKEEICTNGQTLQEVYGTPQTLFRAPYGEFNDDTLRAAAQCGVKALVNWSVLVHAGQISYQQASRLRPGDIVLLHFTENMERDLAAIFAAAQAQNLQIGRLEDWLH